MKCVKNPCNRFLPGLKFMRNTAFAYLRRIACMKLFVRQRFTGMRNYSLHTMHILQILTHSTGFEMNSYTRKKLVFMSGAVRLSQLLMGNFSRITYGGINAKRHFEKRVQERVFFKSFQSGRVQNTRIPWHNGIKSMTLPSFNYIFKHPRYYTFLLFVALNPNPFRWIFDNSKLFARISMSIESEVEFIMKDTFEKIKTPQIYCQSEFVKQRILFYTYSIIFANYGENVSFHDFLKTLLRELDLKDPPQDFSICVKPSSV